MNNNSCLQWNNLFQDVWNRFIFWGGRLVKSSFDAKAVQTSYYNLNSFTLPPIQLIICLLYNLWPVFGLHNQLQPAFWCKLKNRVFSCFFAIFQLFCTKNAENEDFDQCLHSVWTVTSVCDSTQTLVEIYNNPTTGRNKHSCFDFDGRQDDIQRIRSSFARKRVFNFRDELRGQDRARDLLRHQVPGLGTDLRQRLRMQLAHLSRSFQYDYRYYLC